MTELTAREQIALAIDTSETAEAERLARVAQEAGARYVKLGLGLSTATSWQYCSELAGEHGLGWVADAKLKDIPNTVGEAVHNIAALEHKPFGITMFTSAGSESMSVAQREAGDIKMLGVTILTSIEAEEAARIHGIGVEIADIMTLHEMIADMESVTEQGQQRQQAIIDKYFSERAKEKISEKVLEFACEAARAGLKGVVCSPQEVGRIKQAPETSGLFAMIPGVRSLKADAQDQSRTGTPAATIEAGADLLVIGRQITQAPDPAEAYEAVVAEIMGAK
jgi:orotidine-5'-phosphate decarboxylase